MMFILENVFSTIKSQRYNFLLKMSQNQELRELDQLVSYANQQTHYKLIFAEASRTYAIQQLGLDALSPQFIRELIISKKDHLEGKTSEQNFDSPSKNPYWGHSQFKAFVWIALCYAAMISKELSQFNEENVDFLRTIFPCKSKEFVMYHLCSLNKFSKESRANWDAEESNLLVQLVKESSGKLQWSQISYDLFVRSDCKIYKSREKCREQWINHLDPELNKGKWSKSEDILLFSSILKDGKKWSLISKHFQGSRSEHMVKNRYNSLLKKSKLRYGRLIDKSVEEKILKQLQRQHLRYLSRQTKQTKKEAKKQVQATNLSQMKAMKEMQENKEEENIPELQNIQSQWIFEHCINTRNWNREEELQEIEMYSQECFHLKDDSLLPFLI